MENYDHALDTALNLVSPDGDSYERGAEAFRTTLAANNGDEHDVDAAIHYGLFAAMDNQVDPDMFWAAYQAFWDVNEKADPSDDDQSPMRAIG